MEVLHQNQQCVLSMWDDPYCRDGWPMLTNIVDQCFPPPPLSTQSGQWAKSKRLIKGISSLGWLQHKPVKWMGSHKAGLSDLPVTHALEQLGSWSRAGDSSWDLAKCCSLLTLLMPLLSFALIAGDQPHSIWGLPHAREIPKEAIKLQQAA